MTVEAHDPHLRRVWGRERSRMGEAPRPPGALQVIEPPCRVTSSLYALLFAAGYSLGMPSVVGWGLWAHGVEWAGPCVVLPVFAAAFLPRARLWWDAAMFCASGSVEVTAGRVRVHGRRTVALDFDKGQVAAVFRYCGRGYGKAPW